MILIYVSVILIFADSPSEVEPEAVDSMFATMNGHSWSSLVTNKESPIEFYFASDARYESVYDMKNNCCIFE